MTQFEGTPNLPSPQTYQRAIFHLVSEHNLDTNEMIAQEAQKRQEADYQFNAYIGKIGTMAYQITEHNRSDNSLFDEGAGDSFSTGAIFGTFLAERIHGDVVSLDELMLALPQPLVSDQSASRKERRRNAAIPYLIEGLIGHRLFINGRSETILEPIEGHIVSDDTKRYFFNVGLGLILLAADTVHRSKLDVSWNDFPNTDD